MAEITVLPVRTRYVYFLMLRATPAWLQLTREERRSIQGECMSKLLKEDADLTMRFFDAEAFTAICSDVAMLEAGDPREYYFFMEGLRDSVLLAKPYFEVVQIIPALEGGFAEYEQALAG